MTSRPATPADYPRLRELANASAYPYPDPTDPLIEAIYVVEDEHGNIIGACAAKRILELYLYKGKCGHPATVLHMVRMLHSCMCTCLRAKGHSEVNAFIPSQLVKSFGRRLEKTFGWRPNWKSWVKEI